MPDRKRHRAPMPVGYWPLWTTVALDLVGFGIVMPILSRYAERFGANGFQVGLLFASYSLAQFVCSPLLGRLSDRIGRKPVIVIALIGTAVGSLLTGLANSLLVLFLGRILDGASGASIAVAQAAVADISEPAQRPRLLGLLGAAFGVGFVLGPAIGGLAALGGPEIPFYMAAAIAGANAVAALVRLPARKPTAARQRAGAQRRGRPTRAATPQLRALARVGFVSTAGFVAFETMFGKLGRARFDIGEGSTAALFLMVGLVLVAIQGGIYGRVSGARSIGSLAFSGQFVAAVGLCAVAAATTWWALIPALLVIAVGQGFASPAMTTLVSALAPPDRRGEAVGYQQSAYALARIVGPPSAGLLFDHVGHWSPFALGGVLMAGAALLLASSGLRSAGVGGPPGGAPVHAVSAS